MVTNVLILIGRKRIYFKALILIKYYYSLKKVSPEYVSYMKYLVYKAKKKIIYPFEANHMSSGGGGERPPAKPSHILVLLRIIQTEDVLDRFSLEQN